MNHKLKLADAFLTRRDFLTRCGMGFGMLGLANVLAPQLVTAAEAIGSNSPLAPKAPQFPAKAKRVIHIFANGGPSHVDTFDPKPELARLHGKPLPMDNLKTERKTGAAFQSPFKFKKYGQSGIEVSELFSNVAEHIDDIAVIRSMNADVPNHEPSLLLMNCGEARLPRPLRRSGRSGASAAGRPTTAGPWRALRRWRWPCGVCRQGRRSRRTVHPARRCG
jgi:hypothetical protein